MGVDPLGVEEQEAGVPAERRRDERTVLDVGQGPRERPSPQEIAEDLDERIRRVEAAGALTRWGR